MGLREGDPSDIRCEVLHINTERSMRGGEVQTLGLMRELEAQGCRSALVARDRSPLLRRAQADGYQVIALKARGDLDLLAALRLRRWIKAAGAKIVHAHTAHALPLALMALKGLSPRPCLVASRRVSFPLRSPVSRWKYRSADAVVAVSEEVRRGLMAQGIDGSTIQTIHSGVDLGLFRNLPSREVARARFGIPGNALAVGTVGALVHHKGHEVLLAALSALKFEKGPLELCLAGEGPLRRRFEVQAAELDVSLRLLGYLHLPGELYPALDLVVLPSLSGEGSPGVIKEAAAAGVPVIATDVGGTGEILRDGREALIVPPGDVGALRSALERLLGDPELRQTLAGAARLRVEGFTIAQMAQAHVVLYRKLVGEEGLRFSPAGCSKDSREIVF